MHYVDVLYIAVYASSKKLPSEVTNNAPNSTKLQQQYQ